MALRAELLNQHQSDDRAKGPYIDGGVSMLRLVSSKIDFRLLNRIYSLTQS